MFFREVANFVRLQYPPRGRQVGLNLADGMALAEHPEGFFQIDVFAGQDGSGALVRDLFQQIGVHPRNHIFHPSEVVLLVSLAEADD